ncbi:glucosamine kinase [Aurantimicrobium minutum]|uniref:N-acetylglucosamine kinase n=1 Tax=Aurantimicrobium minutum TaxID=708131 RepID=UPI002476D498|nr:BadF/BadG/BcrA/BcrD ATPase family protein [Aurantimicrobium minutum]MDH6277057.1 glucosamine kinase [Aurantimicrobium minutum]
MWRLDVEFTVRVEGNAMNAPLGENLTLALDAGQTGVRTLLIRGAERESKQFPGLKTDSELFPQLAHIITSALEGVTEAVSLSIGMTGLTTSQSKPDDLLAMLPSNVFRVSLAHDSITGFLGSMGVENGTVTAVGTGVVTLAVGETEMARIDGWGNLIGDAGSAYWIGRAGLDAGMRVYDGRIVASTLIELLTENFSHPEEAYIDLQTSHDRVARIASFAQQVIEHAQEDAVAREIVEEAGRELAISAVTGARRVGLLETESPLFSWAGNMMKAQQLKESFLAHIAEVVPHAEFAEPLAEPIDGVAVMDLLPQTSPLRSVIHTAIRP